MKKHLLNLINNKDILILGYGKEGMSTYNLLKEIGGYKSIAIADQNEVNENDVKVYTGYNYLDAMNNHDVVFKSPGIALLKPFNEYKTKITSQVEQFLEVYKNRVIGVTGTKGKSTVSSLIYHVIKENNNNVVYGGNIGLPVFDLVDNINDDTKIVLELSCHQLEELKVSPKVAVFLNLFEDHLERYKTMEVYKDAKSNIYLHQNSIDILYYNKDLNLTNIKSTSYLTNDYHFNDINIFNNKGLKGEHSLYNINVVYMVTKYLNLSDDKFIKCINSFKTLPHRLEYIGTYNKVDYYDDSIATTAESAVSAVKSIKNAKTILLGGMDRGINYDNLIKELLNSDIENILLMYEAGDRIFSSIKDSNNKNIIKLNDLRECTLWCLENAKEGSAVLLSPAAASYGYFKNFEERGDYFKKLLEENS